MRSFNAGEIAEVCGVIKRLGNDQFRQQAL